MRKLFFLVLFFASATSGFVFSQPCKNDFQYRVPITLTNHNTVPLNNFQVKINIDTYYLIDTGKVRIDGGDIRFTNSAGSFLSYWFNPATFNTANTEFWVKVDHLPANGTATIYLFYGNPSAATQSSGNATFEMFDDFGGTSLNYSKWDRCGAVSNVIVSGGSAYFKSSGANRDGLIFSKQDFSNVVVVEADIESTSAGKTVLGLIDPLDYGYATTMEETALNVFTMKVSKIESSSPCYNIFDPSSVTPNNLSVSGVWSFSWNKAITQTMGYNNLATSFDYHDNTYQTSFDSSKRVIIGSKYNPSFNPDSCSVDWIRVRLYADSAVTAVISTEQEYPVAPEAENNGPACGGEPIHFSSNYYPGVLYVWKKHDNSAFSFTNDTTVIADTSYNGICTVEARMPGCIDPVVSHTTVSVSLPSVSGTTSGAAVVCSGTNNGYVFVTGCTGNVIRWEMANAVSGPWYTISSNNDTITYSDLIQNTYFRPVIKTSSCPEAVGSSVLITVSSPTNGGFIIGASPVCAGNNNGVLNLIYSTGTILQWQSSEDNFATWDTSYSGSSFTFNDLDTTTYFRVMVKNGSCPSLYSGTAIVTVNPLPEPYFTASPVCEGMPTVFEDSSTISLGTITGYQWNFGNSNSSISSDPVYTYPSPQIYLVGLTVTSSAGCVNSYSAAVTVNPLPIVEFNALAGCLGTSTVFQSIVTVPFGGNVQSFLWDHDNGTTDNTGSHSYLYPASGLYNVQLTVTTNNGCVDSVSHPIIITSPVNVGFISDSVCLGEYINFVNTSSSGIPATINYTWDFGNGATSNLISPNYTYQAPGDYIVTLQAQTAGSSSSCISSHQDTIRIFEVPAPEFTFLNVCLSDSASFNNTTFYSGNSTDVSYIWSFGDAVTDTLINPNHLYQSPGNYNVTLTANTVNGCSSAKTHLLTVYPMPVANFASTDVCDGFFMNFTSTSSVSSGSLSFSWQFGDAAFSAVPNPDHMYSDNGIYDVTLITTTNNNCTDTISKQVTVYPVPYVDFLNTPVCDGQPSSFSEIASIDTGNVVLFQWDFGDGSSSGSSITSHQYSIPGTYYVKLTATSDFGCVNDTTKMVNVNYVPVPDFSVTGTCLYTPNQFTNLSTIFDGSPMLYSWSFGNGDSSHLTSPGYIYSNPGIFQVTLVVSSGPGCADSVMKYAEVYTLPVVNAGPDTSISKGNEIMLNGFMPAGVYYAWLPLSTISNSSVPNPIARPDETTTYILTMTDVNGCQNTDSVTVTVENDFKLLIYNVVTPDGNGQNDFWEIENIDFYPDTKVQIFNRWGEKVYEKTGYNNDWQGTYNNDQLPDGSYYYIISFPDTDFHYKGTITLLRNN